MAFSGLDTSDPLIANKFLLNKCPVCRTESDLVLTSKFYFDSREERDLLEEKRMAHFQAIDQNREEKEGLVIRLLQPRR
ncbi:hypothetical protein ElyMa_001656300 [Elysia marginata]|uniref:Cdk-activating kinase assembly factor MAT1 centre domain-containing protein n=1 Tax=Elysia marginata TaxID=1093978 RepID=A0AAV4JMX8_9GAST|nr:hypothetical protein ElyMa_001656300 [Elysia marginata]